MAGFIGRSMQARGAHQTLSPIFDITRDPRWGRIEETYGEDPYLVMDIGRGLRARHSRGRASPRPASISSATALPEGGMNRAPAHIGPRELRDTFLLPFEVAVRGPACAR